MANKFNVLIWTILLLCRGSWANLSHGAALAKLRDAGIPVWSSGNCSDRNNPNCTSLEQIREITIENIIILKRASGCPITVTGGTETGHGSGAGQSHWNGWKIDISLNDCINGYITRTFTYIGQRRGDNAALYRSTADNIYAREGNHWDILYRNLSN